MPKDKETIGKDDTYSGKNDGITFEKFDDQIISWCREKYGDKYAVAFWKDELMNLALLTSRMSWTITVLKITVNGCLTYCP